MNIDDDRDCDGILDPSADVDIAAAPPSDGSSSPTAFYSEPRSRRPGPASLASRDSLSEGRRGAIGVDGQRRVPVHNAGGASSCFASRSAAAS